MCVMLLVFIGDQWFCDILYNLTLKERFQNRRKYSEVSGLNKDAGVGFPDRNVPYSLQRSQ